MCVCVQAAGVCHYHGDVTAAVIQRGAESLVLSFTPLNTAIIWQTVALETVANTAHLFL